MGNCTFKGVSREFPKSIRVLTDSRSVLEFKGPKLVGEVLHSYPGYGIFQQGHGSSPVPNDELLLCGKSYYLLPIEKEAMLCNKGLNEEEPNNEYFPEKLDTDWVNNVDETDNIKNSSSEASEYVESLGDGAAFEVLSSGDDGVWKVKLMINTKKLEEILSEQGNIEGLIERMSMVASLTPRHSKSFRAEGWRPSFSNLFKAPIESRRKKQADHLLTSLLVLVLSEEKLVALLETRNFTFINFKGFLEFVGGLKCTQQGIFFFSFLNILLGYLSNLCLSNLYIQ